MLSFTVAQQQLIESDWKKVSWKFQITDTQTPANTYYWSTKTISGTPDYEFKIIPESFRGVKVNRCKSEMGMIATLVECSFQIHNKDNTLDPLDFFDATGIITCELTDNVTTASRAWKIRIIQCTSLKQRLTFSCTDGFRSFIEGDYPTKGKISDLFKSDNTLADDNVCLPVTFGIAYIPLRLITSGANDYYVLGTRKDISDADYTYTIYGQKTPKAFSANQDEYLNSNYTFTQSNLADAYGIDRKVFQNNIDGGNNNNFPGSYFFDVPTCFRRSGALNGFTPLAAIQRILDDSHVGLNGIWTDLDWFAFDSDDITAAAVYFTSWLMEWTGGLYISSSKEKLIANLLQMCHSTVKAESTSNDLGFGVLIKASQRTITQKDVIKDSFRRELLTKEINDSGYVSFPDLGPETLDENDFSTHAKWTATNDCDDTGGNATWTFAGGLASTLTQASGDFITPAIGERLYRLTYRISGVTGAPTASITTSFAAVSTNLDTSLATIQQLIFASANTPGDFVITSTLIAGQAFTIDFLYLQIQTVQDELTQILVPCKEGGAMANPSTEVLELPLIQNNIMAQKLGILHFQRKFLKMAQIRFTSKVRLFAIQADDIITIDEDDYGGTYDVLVDSMFINKNLTIEMECTQFSDYLDDYDDLTPTAITKATVTPQAAIMASPARMFMADFTATPVKSGQVLKTWFWNGNIADDASITCPTITTNGFMIITGGVTDKSCAMIAIQADGNYTVLFASGLYAYNADTDTKLCIGTAVQNPLIIKNRLGSTKNIIVLFWYN